MDLSDLIEASAIMPALEGELEEAAAAVAGRAGRRHHRHPEREIFDTILQRERLGSTGVGNGIAIPHGKLAGVKRITGVFARLETPVDFEALDDQPVDLVFLLLAPEGRRRRSSQGAVAHCPRAARRRHGRQDPRHQATPAPSTRCCRRRRPRTRPDSSEVLRMHKGRLWPPFVSECGASRPQWMLTGTRSFSKAPAIARSRCVRQQDRLAVGGKQRPQLGARRDLGKPGEFALQIVAVHFAQIGDRALAEMGEIALA